MFEHYFNKGEEGELLGLVVNLPLAVGPPGKRTHPASLLYVNVPFAMEPSMVGSCAGGG